MIKLNDNYTRIAENYLFATVSKKVADYKDANPGADIIRLGIGDVTLPLAHAVTEAMRRAVDEEGVKETFRGYCDEQGYMFLREAVQDYYGEKGVDLDTSEIFISDGAKSDLGNLPDLFDADNKILIPDPVYPVYVDTNIMAGREISYMTGDYANGFCPLPDDRQRADIIYLCSPNNPTGAVYSKEKLTYIVDYALSNNAVIIFDAAYEAFVKGQYPRSIYEIKGAKNCAIEVSSFSKTAGFTGTRCGYTVVPKALNYGALNRMWLRRQTTKFNGVAYAVQRGAQAVFTKDGRREIEENINYYRENAKIITSALDECGVKYTGGENSPYVWMKCPSGFTSWQFFDYFLTEARVVGTPGSGFGLGGEGWFRLTAFNTTELTAVAAARIKKVINV